MLEGMTPPQKSRGNCKVENIAATLDEADQKILYDAVANQAQWTVKNLIFALKERGIQISDSPLYNHRAQTCACYRS